jgi:hypothetical protein
MVERSTAGFSAAWRTAGGAAAPSAVRVRQVPVAPRPWLASAVGAPPPQLGHGVHSLRRDCRKPRGAVGSTASHAGAHGRRTHGGRRPRPSHRSRTPARSCQGLGTSVRVGRRTSEAAM